MLAPAYDLLCTSLHIPNERRLALDMFADDFETPSYRARGFHTDECFLALAERFGIKPSRAAKLLEPFRQEQPEVPHLIARSFLSEEAKQDYLERYRDRLKALNVAG